MNHSIKPDSRKFSFSDTYRTNEKQEIVVKSMPPLNEYLQTLPENKQQSFSQASRIIKALENYKPPKKTQKLHTPENSPTNPDPALVENGMEIINRKAKRGGRVLIAGGFVRDMLLNKVPKDLDFATDLDEKEIALALKQEFKQEFENKEISIAYKGNNFAVTHVRIKNPETGDTEEYEIATFREDVESDGRQATVKFNTSPNLDAQRRDLTVNALFYNPTTGSIYDFVGGLKDTEEKKLRFVGNPSVRIQEDKLRALRFIRFHFKTGYELDEPAKKYIQENAGAILGTSSFKDSPEKEFKKLSPERIAQEFTQTLLEAVKIEQAGEVLRIYEELNLLKEFLPEIADLKNCEQGPPYHMEGNVFEHTILVLNNLPKTASARLLWAAIFHDVGKPETREETINEGQKKVSFHKHAEAGVNTTIKRLKTLKITSVEIDAIPENQDLSAKELEKSKNKITPEAVAVLVKYHIFFSSLGLDVNQGRPSMSKVINKIEEGLILNEALELARADMLGSIPNSPTIKQTNIENLEKAENYTKEILAYQQKFQEQAGQETSFKTLLAWSEIEKLLGDDLKSEINLRSKIIQTLKNQIRNQGASTEAEIIQLRNAFLEQIKTVAKQDENNDPNHSQFILRAIIRSQATTLEDMENIRIQITAQTLK